MRKLAALFVGMLFVQIPAFAAKQDGALFQESSPVRIKELVRIQGARENPVVGYGLVVGLAGTGDGPRSRATMQSLGNALQRFGVHVGDAQITSRNVAAVMVTGSLPPHANPGDKLDISVSCIGDARSLVGGTLLLTPLQGADDQTYVLAQGPVMVGGYRYDAFGNLLQKNHPTVGTVSEGGLVEATSPSSVMSASGAIHLLLHSPDYTTASRIAQALAAEFGQARLGADIIAEGPSRVTFRLNDGERQRLVDGLRQVESLSVTPDLLARVVVNERTGTIVSGGNVRLGAVSITQGNLSVSIETDFRVSQPSLLVDPGNAIRSVVVPDTRIEALEAEAATVVLASGANVSELATALGGIKATPREVISILQAIQRAGALHAELIVQ